MQGSITKAGNTHVRALTNRPGITKSYSTSGHLRARWAKVDRRFGLAGTPATGASSAGRFTERGKNPLVANVAIARELALVLVSRPCNKPASTKLG